MGLVGAAAGMAYKNHQRSESKQAYENDERKYLEKLELDPNDSRARYNYTIFLELLRAEEGLRWSRETVPEGPGA